MINARSRSKWARAARNKGRRIPRGDIETIVKKVPRVSTINKKIKRIQAKEELKFIDTYQSATSIPLAGVLQLLNGVAEGDDNNNREGREINLTSVQFRGQLLNNPLDITSAVIRMIIFYDLQANGAAPTVATLLDLTTITAAYLAPYHRDYQKRYKIVYDKTMTITPQTVNTTAGGVTTVVNSIDRTIRKKRRLGRMVKYSGTGATITSIASNSLYVLFLSDNNTNQPSINMGYRVYYKDT